LVKESNAIIAKKEDDSMNKKQSDFSSSSVEGEYYDYYISTYGDKRRCLYKNIGGQELIVFDEPVSAGAFFPTDYYSYYVDGNGLRHRGHIVSNKLVGEEVADFPDPFAPDYDIVSYEDGRLVITHYVYGVAMSEKPYVETPTENDFVYKDASGMMEHHVKQAFSFHGLRKRQVVPFKTRLALADPEVKERYEAVKKFALTYPLKERISIPRSTFSAHRKPYLIFAFARKNLKLYFHLDPKDYDGTPIPHEDVSDKKTYKKTPLLFRLTSNLAVKRAEDLIVTMMKADKIEPKKK
jgi:hypothetical protein